VSFACRRIRRSKPVSGAAPVRLAIDVNRWRSRTPPHPLAVRALCLKSGSAASPRAVHSELLLGYQTEGAAEIVEVASVLPGTCRPSTLPVWMQNKEPSALYSIDQRLELSGGRLQMTGQERLPEYGGHNAPKQP
jgi:hypothetical protein